MVLKKPSKRLGGNQCIDWPFVQTSFGRDFWTIAASLFLILLAAALNEDVDRPVIGSGWVNEGLNTTVIS